MMTIALSLFYKHFTHVIVTRFNLNQLHSSAALNIPISFIAYDELRLHAVDQRAIADGDVVEVIPTMAGG